MLDPPFTEADVRYLLRTRKVVQGVIKDTTTNPAAPLLEIIYRIIRAGNRVDDIKLRLHARRPKPVLDTLIRPRPSASLLWHGERIRGIDHKIVHDVIKNGLIVGEVRGWHEHRWTLMDRDRPVISVNDEMKKIQEDFRSILRFCMARWRIEVEEDEDRQEILKFMR
ncbi:MAG TPA: hypothetical protein VN843_32195 [Anaerolineales bacterium]|nr:hypothetical protein [Anaerolineales bacterium]